MADGRELWGAARVDPVALLNRVRLSRYMKLVYMYPGTVPTSMRRTILSRIQNENQVMRIQNSEIRSAQIHLTTNQNSSTCVHSTAVQYSVNLRYPSSRDTHADFYVV
eukprot:COSAG03_NODE_137_length_11785_cov_19.757827_5_plen_108_part_00